MQARPAFFVKLTQRLITLFNYQDTTGIFGSKIIKNINYQATNSKNQEI